MPPLKSWLAVRFVSTIEGRSRQGRPCGCEDGSNGWEIEARHSAFRPTMRTKSSAKPLSRWWPCSGLRWSRASRQRFWHSNALETRSAALRRLRSAGHHSACCVRMSCAPSRVNLAGSRPSRRRFTEREVPCRFLSTPQWPIRWPAPTWGDRSSLFRCSADMDLGCVGPCRNAVAAVTVPRPCVLLLQDHTHSGLVFVVNPGDGTAAPRTASGFFAATIQPDKFPRPAVFLARQISRASRSFAVLRPSVRRARTLTHRITPRPRWARPG